MPFSRAFAWLLAPTLLLAVPRVHGGILPIQDQYIPSGKTLVVPIPATDPAGPARSYSVTVGAPTTSGIPTSAAGIVAAIRTGDPHLFIGVTYTDSNSLLQSGTMEFQLLREFSPITTQIIGGLAQGGFYNPLTDGTTSYITFFRVAPGFVIQGGDPKNNGTGGPGFTFENEFSSALIFSATAGQLAMANAGTNYGAGPDGNGGTNGSQFFITLAPVRSFDYSSSIFGQLLRGYGTLDGIAGTPLKENQSYDELSSPISPVNITSATVSSNNTDAVLLLSATGVCDSVITVTASSAGMTSVQSFTAHAVPDTTSDPPFLQPVPDTVARDGTFHLPVQGTDLQLDLLSYGYQRLFPITDTSITSGASPLLAIPLASNTNNEITASVEHWNPPYARYEPDTRLFHVGTGDKPLTGSLTPIPLGHNGSLLLDRFPIALFSTDNLKDTAARFTATVNFGDGTFLSGTDLTIVREPALPPVNRFRLIASHTYQTSGQYPVIVNVADPGGAHLTLTGAANIGPSDIAITAKDISTVNGRLAGRIAGFVDYGSRSIPSDYASTINWGDGSVSPSVVRRIVGGSYEILGAHTYLTSGSFTLSTSVSRTGVAGDSASTWATARVSGIKAPQAFPPFPQAHLAQVWTSLQTDSNSVVITSTDGANPQSGLVQGPNGNLYGVTSAGGVGWGTVYEITTTGSLNILHIFTGGSDGGLPYGPLVTATDGNLYGTSSHEGADGYGTVFQISASGSFTTIYSFTDGEDGANPYGGLIQGTDGNLYGTTSNSNGVINVGEGFGSIFKITTSGSITTLAYFNFNNGAYPEAALVQGTDGYFYGTTTGGGSAFDGAVFQYIPGGSITTLHSFLDGDDGAVPFGSLILGADGTLYGTTETGGRHGGGTVFNITTTGSFGIVYSFAGADGSASYAPLITGTNGNFYGTTKTGGANGDGTVFCLTPGGSLTTLYSFAGPDGNAPQGGLFQTADGNFYGTTSRGGASGDGTVFQLTPGGSITTLHSFVDTALQYYVQATVTIVNSGNVTSQPGSFSAYVDPDGALDGQETILTCGTQTSFAIPSLAPGESWSLEFAGDPYPALSARVTPAEATTTTLESLPYPLQLPVGFDPTGQSIIGVVTYSDPVGDFDGSQKIVSPGSF